MVLMFICVIGSRDRDAANTPHINSVNTATVVEPFMLRQCLPEADDVAFRYADLAHDDIGRTELLQYRRFVTHNTGFNLTFGKLRCVDVPESYRYYVSLTSNFSHAGISGIRILIVELDTHLPTGGGSSFLITSESESRHLCSYEDYFNGTYFAWCPSPNYGCRHISVRLQYFNFTAYTGNHSPIDKLLWKRCVCNWEETIDDFSANARIVTWYRSPGNDWTPKTYDGQPFYPMSTKAFCACVKKFDRLFFVGSSHMRYKANYVMHTCFDMPQRYLPRDRSLSIGNVHFVYVSKSSEYAELWAMELERKNLTDRDVVLFQTGAHDMADFGIQVCTGYLFVIVRYHRMYKRLCMYSINTISISLDVCIFTS